MPGLDALRGVAVLSVVIYHGLHWFLPPAISLSRGVILLSALATPGWLGVNLFFVLSGFLITGILIDTRNRSNYWKSFYTRRALRILPLYLVVLLILRLQGVSWIYLFFCLIYLANFTAALRIRTGYGPLWSLAVEEQFYLFWPFLVRRLSMRTLAIVCAGDIFLSPILRFLSAAGIFHLGDISSATWLVSDNLATGALIAILLRSSAAERITVRGFSLVVFVAGAVLFIFQFRLHLLTRANPMGAALQSEPFLIMFAALLLFSIRYGEHAIFFRLTAPLRFYGYVSYGLYMLHMIGFGIYIRIFPASQSLRPRLTLAPVLTRFFVVLSLSTLICYLSRRYFEEYFLRLKDRLVPPVASNNIPGPGLSAQQVSSSNGPLSVESRP
ncbi:MAG: acyltransferase [Acidobacteriota bacterium]|nr:acyltransferase [Acidobacteriota bacterium]